MASKLQDLKPKAIWEHFSDINKIPRASTKEKQIIQYMVEFGKSLGLETVVDGIGNVIIKKPATKGKERHKIVVLQGHLDMVHQKNASSNFDFETQGIDMYIDGDWVKAKDTTLGADNGIGVATIMAVLSSNNIEHPPIEALFTIDEEAGMSGAEALTSNQLSGEILLNLDTEEEDEIIIGCAGGVEVEIEGNYTLEALDDTYQFYTLSIDGLTGGHSGMDIHLNRANAIKVLVKILSELPCKISNIDAGTLTNVIPRHGTAVIAVKKDISVADRLKKILKKIKEEFKSTDGSMIASIKEIKNKSQVISKKNQTQILEKLLKIPNGVYSFTQGMPELVQTSNNLARISLENGTYKIACHIRSSVDTERDELVSKVNSLSFNAKVSEIGPYPGWKPQPKSNLLKIAKDCFNELHKEYPKVKSIHAGLECGILSGIYPEMEMISFGPNIRGAHTTDERLQITSTQRFWEFLVNLLKEL